MVIRFLLVVLSVPAVVFGAMTCWEAIDVGLLTDPGPVGPYSFGSIAMVEMYGWSYTSQFAFLVSGLTKGLSLVAVGGFLAFKGTKRRVVSAT
jgi:hypothetical protein